MAGFFLSLKFLNGSMPTVHGVETVVMGVQEIGRPSELVLIRHAESDRNDAKRGSVYFADDAARRLIRGVPDYKVRLTNRGIEQALATGMHLANLYELPDYFYHSGYERAEHTLRLILSQFTAKSGVSSDHVVRMNPFIRERHSGYAYDMTTEEAETAFPWLKEYWQTHGGFFAQPPGGESLAEVAERVYLFLNMLFRDRAGKRVWVVTHGGTLRVFRFLLERWTYDDAIAWKTNDSPDNCGITRYLYNHDAGKLHLEEHNTILYDRSLVSKP